MDRQEPVLSEEDLENTFGPSSEIQDELASPGFLSMDEVQEPLPVGSIGPLPRATDHTALTRALLLLGVSVVLLAVAQMVIFLMQTRTPTQVEVASTPEAAAPHQALDTTLRKARLQLDHALYEDVVTLLEPLAGTTSNLTEDQQFQVFLLLSRAYRRLGNVPKAQLYTMKATDQALDRETPADLFSYAQRLLSEGRFEEARRQYASILCRHDGMKEEDRSFRILAEIRLADAFLREARAHPRAPGLPGDQFLTVKESLP